MYPKVQGGSGFLRSNSVKVRGGSSFSQPISDEMEHS